GARGGAEIDGERDSLPLPFGEREENIRRLEYARRLLPVILKRRSKGRSADRDPLRDVASRRRLEREDAIIELDEIERCTRSHVEIVGELDRLRGRGEGVFERARSLTRAGNEIDAKRSRSRHELVLVE